MVQINLENKKDLYKLYISDCCKMREYRIDLVTISEGFGIVMVAERSMNWDPGAYRTMVQWEQAFPAPLLRGPVLLMVFLET